MAIDNNDNQEEYMSYSIKERLAQKQVNVNPNTEKEVEMRWKAIEQLRAGIDSKNMADASICLVNTAGKNHVE